MRLLVVSRLIPVAAPFSTGAPTTAVLLKHCFRTKTEQIGHKKDLLADDMHQKLSG